MSWRKQKNKENKDNKGHKAKKGSGHAGRRGGVLHRATDWINQLIHWLSTPLNLFRFLVILFALDFLAFMSLTRSSYLQLVNPLYFLWSEPGESRNYLELYFPKSLSLTGIEAMYPEAELQKPLEKNIPPEKPLDDAAVAAEVVLVRKRVAAPVEQVGQNKLSREEAVARRVILELVAGPTGGELETLKARNLLKEPLFLRALWTYSGVLYISTEKAIWERMSPNERKITEYCVRESLARALPQTRFQILKE